MHIKRIGIAATAVVAMTLTGVPVLTVGIANLHASSHVSAASQATDRAAIAEARLDATKLKVCQLREKAIDNIMARIGDRGQKQLDLFTTIATRVETFYTTKGKTLSNYDALVADVNAKKAAAQTAVDTVKADKANFKCDGTDPQGAAATFKADLKLEISALKAYRTSVKNLIVGVKSVQGTTSSTENSNRGGSQ